MLTTLWRAIWRFAHVPRRHRTTVNQAAPDTEGTDRSIPRSAGRGKDQPRTASLLMKGDIPPARQTPRRALSAAEEETRRQKQARLRAEYEREFPYETASRRLAPEERIGKRGPVVSGGLPSLGKRK
jgi:hypothetical protein